MSITAVVPVWNGRDLLARLLDTLDRQTLRAGETIVVDNGSSDGAPELARERGARVIPMGRNAGFAAAVNRGIGEARSDHVAILNSDVELEPEYFARLAASPAWFATGKILDARRDGSIDGTFDLTCRGGTTWRAGSGRADGPLWSEPRTIWSAPWTAALYRAEVFGKVGLLEERFESYLEDVDFGMRCAAKGIAGGYVPEAVAWHHGSATLGRWHPDTVRRIARNQVWLAARHLPARCWWPVVVAQGLWGGVAARHGAAAAWTRGILEGLKSFRDMRAYAPELPEHLRESERSIAELQAAAGADLYWKLYLMLTNGGAK
ncbi:MAG: glycosyl transferase, family 2 [Burkholderiales bacterium]|nr:glycosyl transferase, family 2 [Burkholderiales bacterium]